MRYAWLLILVAGCVPPEARVYGPVYTPTIREAHPDWSADDVRRVAEGEFFVGMTIEQFECSYTYGRLNNLLNSTPEGEHRHRIFNHSSRTSTAKSYGYLDGLWFTVGYFDLEERMFEFSKTTR